MFAVYVVYHGLLLQMKLSNSLVVMYLFLISLKKKKKKQLYFRHLLCVFFRVADMLAIPTLDHEVLGFNPAVGGIQLMTVLHLVAQIITFQSPILLKGI